jgi:hypothetical protein
MKTNSRTRLALLFTLIFASMVVATTQGKQKSGSVESVQVMITGIELGDLDGRGQINDATIHCNVRIYVGAGGRYRVSLTADILYLGDEPVLPDEIRKKDYFRLKQAIYVEASGAGWVEADFSFDLFNKYGWYKAEIVAVCDRVSATSEPWIFDPPRGSAGPMRY